MWYPRWFSHSGKALLSWFAPRSYKNPRAPRSYPSQGLYEALLEEALAKVAPSIMAKVSSGQTPIPQADCDHRSLCLQGAAPGVTHLPHTPSSSPPVPPSLSQHHPCAIFHHTAYAVHLLGWPMCSSVSGNLSFWWAGPSQVSCICDRTRIIRVLFLPLCSIYFPSPPPPFAPA